MTQPRPFYVAGRPEAGVERLEVVHPYDGGAVGSTTVPTRDQVERAVAAAVAVVPTAARLTAAARADALMHVSGRLAERSDELAELITAENGKPIRWARAETGRAVSVFRFAAEEARRWNGELMRLDTDESAAGRAAVVRRFPHGPVLGIAPFNFPLNLVAHKVAPAIAVGAPIVLKPALTTPLSALLLGELLAETDLPAGAFSVLPVPNEVAAELVGDPRLPVVSFTGSEGVGWGIREAAPRKHVVLELGGNAAALVCADYSSDADLDHAAQRIATFSSYQAGQSCIAVQRVVVDSTLYERFLPRLVAAVAAQRTGDPRDPDTDVGPVLDERNAERIVGWVDEAVGAGAQLLAGGTRTGTTVAPTLVAEVPADARLRTEEVFGPVLTVEAADGLDAQLAAVNDSRFGLQAGVFTHDVRTAFRAHTELEVGGVVIGDVPSYRADQMPYGGVKQSGIGREGVLSTMRDLTHERVMVLTGLEL